MLRVNWPVVDTIHPQSNKFAMGMKMNKNLMSALMV